MKDNLLKVVLTSTLFLSAIIPLSGTSILAEGKTDDFKVQVFSTDEKVRKLQPGVFNFIRGTYFEHANEFPDSNEPVEVLETYLNGINSPTVDTFGALVEKYPDSRHANVGLAMAYYEQYKLTKDKKDLQKALHKEMKAAEIALENGKVLYSTWISFMVTHSKSLGEEQKLLLRMKSLLT